MGVKEIWEKNNDEPRIIGEEIFGKRGKLGRTDVIVVEAKKNDRKMMMNQE